MQQIHANLSQIIDGIESTGDFDEAFFDTQTGQVQIITEEDTAAANDESLAATASDWQQDAIKIARQIEADRDASDNRFIPLPDSFDAHEWQMMAEFVATIEDADVKQQLKRAIHGGGAFRRFKDTVDSLDMAKQWYAFRDTCYRTLAIEWCEENEIKWK